MGLWEISEELVISTAVELSGCSGDGGCFRLISCRVFLSGTIYFAVKNNVVISTSAADDTTYFMVCVMVCSEPFYLGMLSFSTRKMWAPVLLLDFDLLLKACIGVDNKYEIRPLFRA